MTSEQNFRDYLIKTHTQRGRYRRQRTVDLHLSLFYRLRTCCPDLTIEQIRDYLDSLYTRGRTGTYINDYIDMLHLYGRCMNTTTYDSLTYYPEKEFVQETMSEDEIRAFISLPAPTISRYDPRQKKEISYIFDPAGYQIYTLFFSILAYTGMRPGECAHLTIDDVDFGRQVFKLRAENVKTNEYRLVPIPVLLIQQIKDHIAGMSGDLLFGSRRKGGAVMDSVDWGYQFHARLKRLGIKRKNLRPSSLRPSFITRMLSEDIALSKVQKIVGHKQITTTAHYTHHTTKDIINTIKQDPLARESLTPEERMRQLRSVIESIGLFVSSLYKTDNGYIVEILKE